MNISRISLRQFRNLEPTELIPIGGFNVFWGNNAQGKTNLLEGIHLLGSLKSFRGARNDELIQHGETTCRLAAEIENRGVRRQVELSIGPQGKAARVDGKEVRRPADFFGHLRPVLFSPEEVTLLRGGPAGRRGLLDRAVFQADLTFLDRAREYDRCLRQRNRLLREGRGADQLAPWTEALVSAGARLRLDRGRYLDRLLPLLQKAHRQIAGGEEEVDISYRRGTEADLIDSLRGELERAKQREKMLGQTLVGPHRDDLEFCLLGRSLRLFASQGQLRSFLLAFKTAQIEDLQNITGVPPVLLLDDMTSELDRCRQNYFFSYLRARQGQVFITTTDIEPLLAHGISTARYFRVEKGTLHHDRDE
ncbi:MAG: DNA replication/repair protein RecF [Desulfuromonadales bacterium]|nr:DNA replication/repair protein RecF [Desulfuromonadales bacterium]